MSGPGLPPQSPASSPSWDPGSSSKGAPGAPPPTPLCVSHAEIMWCSSDHQNNCWGGVYLKPQSHHHMTHSKGFLITSMLDSQALFTSFVWDFPWMSCSCFCMQQTCPGNCIEQQLHFMFVWPPHDTRSAIVLGYTAGSSVQSLDRYQEPYWWGWTPDVSAYSHSAQPHGLSVSAKRNNKGWVCVGFQIKGQISAKLLSKSKKTYPNGKQTALHDPHLQECSVVSHF